MVERAGTLDYQAREIFNDVRSPASLLFMKLNADTQYLKPGQILIVADPDTPYQLTMQILNTLRLAKNKTNAALIGVSNDDASFMHKHYGVIAALTNGGGNLLSTAGDLGEKYFNTIEQTLKKIEATYQNQFLTRGTLISQQFFVERNQLLNQLNGLVNKPLLKFLSRYTIKFKQYENLKRALNLSSKSIVHEWSTVGIGVIPGYSYYVDNAARAARFLKTGGYIGIGLSFTGTTSEVVRACTIGREDICRTVAFKEYSKFALSTGGGLVGGVWGSSAMVGVCAAVGLATVGVGGVACAAIGSIAGGYAGSVAGEKLFNVFLE